MVTLFYLAVPAVPEPAVSRRPVRACAQKDVGFYSKPTMVCGIPGHPAKCQCHWPAPKKAELESKEVQSKEQSPAKLKN